MKEILELLDKSGFIIGYKIEEYKEFKDGFFVKILVSIIDSSSLIIREYSDSKERNYSYHWQDKNSKLIIRWDNSPYHKKVDTYPHHKHQGDEVLPSYEIAIKDVLHFIEVNFKKNN